MSIMNVGFNRRKVYFILHCGTERMAQLSTCDASIRTWVQIPWSQVRSWLWQFMPVTPAGRAEMGRMLTSLVSWSRWMDELQVQLDTLSQNIKSEHNQGKTPVRTPAFMCTHLHSPQQQVHRACMQPPKDRSKNWSHLSKSAYSRSRYYK